MIDLLIRNGTVVNADGRCRADVAVRDGKIVAVRESVGASLVTPAIGDVLVPGIESVPGTEPAPEDLLAFDTVPIPRTVLAPEGVAATGTVPALEISPSTKIVDATGLLVLPGAVDVHNHFELSFGSFQSADDFAAGTRAAACGGVTTIIDFVMPDNGESLSEALAKRQELADPKVCIDYALHMGITYFNDDVSKEMEAVVSNGITSFKVFMTYDFRVDNNELLHILKRTKELGAIALVHAEDHDEISTLREKFIAEGKTDAWYHYISRAESAEAKGVETAIELAKRAEATLFIVHLACEEGLFALEKAREAGFPIYAETCPHYLYFTSDVYKRPDGRNFVCSPAIKGEQSREALWQAMKNGNIFSVGTDHCPFITENKKLGKDDFTKIPNGVMGVENSYPLLLNEANKGNLSFERVVELCSANPASLFGLAPQKGAIKVGADADIVLYDPKKNFTISQSNMHSDLDYTIYEGFSLNGYPVQTYSRGKMVYKDGEFVGTSGWGRYLKRFRG